MLRTIIDVNSELNGEVVRISLYEYDETSNMWRDISELIQDGDDYREVTEQELEETIIYITNYFKEEYPNKLYSVEYEVR